MTFKHLFLTGMLVSLAACGEQEEKPPVDSDSDGGSSGGFGG